ncbi:MAG: RidA family protein [Rhodocyclaceae bacterium]
MKKTIESINPEGWRRANGYSNGIAARGRMVFVAGQVGWDGNMVFHSFDLVDQVRQALMNVVAIVEAAGARTEHITRMTWYLGDAAEYNRRLREIGQTYREVIGRHYPAMTAIQVAGFVEEGAKVEIEATAVVPE